MPNTVSNIPFIIKVSAVIIGAIFAMTLTGDIDDEGKLKLNASVLIKILFSAMFGLLAGDWIIEYMGWTSWSISTHGLVCMICSVFGMTIVGVVYQSIKLITTDKTPYEIIEEVKKTFKAIFK